MNYNGLIHLEDCLSSIYTQDFKDFEVVLVDNASSDKSIEFLQDRFPDVRLIQSPTNLGFAGGNNLGIPHCSGKYVFFLNNDTRMEAGALRNLATAIQRSPEYRVFACFLLKFSNPDLVDSAGDSIYTNGIITTFFDYPARFFSSPREVLAACAGGAAYSREVLNQLDGFDEDFFLIFEDVDLALRARHLGEKILFLPDVRILHKGSATVGGMFSPNKFYFCARNLAPLMLKNFPAAILLRFTPGILAVLTIRFWQSIRWGRKAAFLKGCFDGLRMVPSSLKKRRRIMASSKLSAGALKQLLRPGWRRERLAFKRGDFNIRP